MRPDGWMKYAPGRTACRGRHALRDGAFMRNAFVGNAVPGVPCVELSKYGKVTDNIILQLRNFYDDMKIDKYVIMPNHVHILCEIKKYRSTKFSYNATIPYTISTLKRLTNKEFRENVWQRNYYEHIVRNEKEYQKILEYIKNNPMNWEKDKYF